MLTTGESVVSEGRRVDDKRDGFPAARKSWPQLFLRSACKCIFFFPCDSPLFLFFSCLFVYSHRSPVLALHDAFFWYNSLKERLSVRSQWHRNESDLRCVLVRTTSCVLQEKKKENPRSVRAAKQNSISRLLARATLISKELFYGKMTLIIDPYIFVLFCISLREHVRTHTRTTYFPESANLHL